MKMNLIFNPNMESSDNQQDFKMTTNICVFNAQYQCMKHTNYEWMKFTWFSSLSCEMLSL
jgi:hypothetical protein